MPTDMTIRVRLDVDSYFAVFSDFIDLQVSIYGCGHTPLDAIKGAISGILFDF